MGMRGLVEPQASGYPPVGTASYLGARSFFTVGRRAAFGNYQVFVGLLRFDTSALPDGATVTSAALRLHVLGKADGDNRGLVAEWYGASNWPIDAGDWSLASSGTRVAGGGHHRDLRSGRASSFDLVGLGSVSTTGSTGLRLPSERRSAVGRQLSCRWPRSSIRPCPSRNSWSAIRRRRRWRRRIRVCRWCRGRRRRGGR